MHQNDVLGAGLLIIAYQSLTKRFLQVLNVAGWSLLFLVVAWLVQNVPNLSLVDRSAKDTVMVGYGSELPRMEGSIGATWARRTQGS